MVQMQHKMNKLFLQRILIQIMDGYSILQQGLVTVMIKLGFYIRLMVRHGQAQRDSLRELPQILGIMLLSADTSLPEKGTL